MRNVLGLAAVTLLFGIAGCSGGGGSTGSPAAGGRASVPVFITDSPETDNDHVWVTIFKVEVLNAASTSETVFDDPAGHAIDVKTLRDSSGQRFDFLSNGSLNSGTHTGVRITLGSSLTIFPHGSTMGQSIPLDDSVVRDSNGNAVVTFSLTTPRNLASGNDAVVIDFDLAHFVRLNGKISPVLKEGDHTGISDMSRHESDEHVGTITNVQGTPPGVTFTLHIESTEFKVVTDVNTVIFNSDFSPNPTLANGQTIEITGSFDTATKSVTAKTIKIRVQAQQAAEAEVSGVPSAANAGAMTFMMSTQQVRGFMPTQTTVNVLTNGSTVLRSDGGIVLAASDFFAGLATAQKVEVEGAYDAGTNTLTAARARIVVPGMMTEVHVVLAKGTGTSVNASAGTFTLQPVSEFDGFEFAGTAVQVVTTSATHFRAGEADTTPTAFFAALATPQAVQVQGKFAGGTLTATVVHIPAQPGSH